MKKVSKKYYDRLMELYGNPKWMDRYMKVIEEAGYHIVGLEEIHNGYGDWIYICLSRYLTSWVEGNLYLMFGDDSRTVFYVGEEHKVKVGASRFSPEGMKKFLEMWTELQEHCTNYC